MKCQALSKCYSTPERENKNYVFLSPFRLTTRGLLFLTGSTDESEFPLSGLSSALTCRPKCQNISLCKYVM